MPRHTRYLIGLYAVASFFYWMSLYVYVPTLPIYAQSKSDNLATVGVIVSMYGLWQALVRLPLGIVSDWLGWRKPFILAGALLAGVGAVAMGTAGGAQGLIVGRAITGLAASAWVPLVAVFSGLFPPAEAVRASALLTLAGSVGRLLATGSTGMLNQAGGFPLAFYVAAGAAMAAFGILAVVGEPRRAPKSPELGAIGRLAVRRDVLLPALLGAVVQYANYSITFGFLPVLAREMGATNMEQSLLVTLYIGVVILGNLLATMAVRRLGARRLVAGSFVLLTLGVAVAAPAQALVLLFISQGCIGVAQGIGYPVLMGLSIEQVDAGERTTAMGVHQAVYAIGMFGGPWLSGILADAAGLRPMFWFTAAMCLGLGLLGTRYLTKKTCEV